MLKVKPLSIEEMFIGVGLIPLTILLLQLERPQFAVMSSASLGGILARLYLKETTKEEVERFTALYNEMESRLWKAKEDIEGYKGLNIRHEVYIQNLEMELKKLQTSSQYAYGEVEELRGRLEALKGSNVVPMTRPVATKTAAMSRQPTEFTLTIDAPRGLPCLKASEFPEFVKGFKRLRIVGGSEAGKTPTAKLIAASIQRHRQDIRLLVADPNKNSTKNVHGEPPDYKGKEESLQAVKDLLDLIDRREEGLETDKTFTMLILDECDTLLRESSDLADDIKEIIKRGDHQNVGIALIGQNANVRQWKDFDHSDFDNVVNIAIGDGASSALSNWKLTGTQKTQLEKDFEALSRHAETFNKDKAPLDKFRYALVRGQGVSPQFIEIPRFDSMTFRKPPKPKSTDCPHCGSHETISHGKNRRKCKLCHRTFSA